MMMNKKRRNEIAKVVEQLKQSRDKITQLANEERTAYDSLPDSLKETDNALEMGDNVEFLEAASENVESAIGELLNIYGIHDGK